MAVKTMEDLFLHTLKDVYHAEKQILKALPKMMKKASSQELKTAFETHRGETEVQVERLEKIFELLGKRAQGKPCAAMEGIIEEAKEAMEEIEDEAVLDAALLADAQTVEHYEISRYGTMVAMAKQLGMDEAAGLLEETLAEEKKTDELLTELALNNLNEKAEAA